mmetsp:Transcript_20257/g.52938  ORF Transcript_20257/g.52938 Transcript_20257/m.52938 type:complete len:222 (+) Transcript_20257:695-1360(+)
MQATLQMSTGVLYLAPIIASGQRYCRVWMSHVSCLCVQQALPKSTILQCQRPHSSAAGSSRSRWSGSGRRLFPLPPASAALPCCCGGAAARTLGAGGWAGCGAWPPSAAFFCFFFSFFRWFLVSPPPFRAAATAEGASASASASPPSAASASAWPPSASSSSGASAPRTSACGIGPSCEGLGEALGAPRRCAPAERSTSGSVSITFSGFRSVWMMEHSRCM